MTVASSPVCPRPSTRANPAFPSHSDLTEREGDCLQRAQHRCFPFITTDVMLREGDSFERRRRLDMILAEVPAPPPPKRGAAVESRRKQVMETLRIGGKTYYL